MILWSLVVLGSCTAPGPTATKSFTADTTVFSNPERGFYHRVEIVDLTSTAISSARSNNITLLHSYLHLDNHRSSPISQALLDDLSAGLSLARQNGMKVILRFAYNEGPWPTSEPDASEAWINQHLTQLKPLLAQNADVLAFFDAGFIGAWGEWHSSTHGHDTDINAKTRILKSILANFPANRQVALRLPADLRALKSRLTTAEFDRLGSHQDCFGASEPGDFGTWNRDGSGVQADKDMIGDIGQRHIVDGETCNADSPRADCATALREFPAAHWTSLNIDYEPNVIARYRSQGCFTTMQRSFGYRLRLTAATYSTQATRGGGLTFKATLRNDGWASPLNQRPVFAVLDGPGGTFPLDLSTDPRTWASDAEATIDRNVVVPAAVPAGTYRLSLWLPDQEPRLRSNPGHSIRLANVGTWDASKGYNVVATGIIVAN